MAYGGISTLRDWAKGDRVSNREHLQQPIDGIRELYGMIKGILANPPQGIPPPFLATIVSEGPKGKDGNPAADTSGCVYWLKRQFVKSRDGTATGSQQNPLDWTEPLEIGDMERDDAVSIFPATNLEEFVDDTHLLNRNVASPVLVFEIPCVGTTDNYRIHVFSKELEPLWFKPTGKAAGAGKYLGKVMYFNDQPSDESADLVEADIGTEGDEEIVLMNIREVGAGTWDLWDGDNPDDNSTLNPLAFLGTVAGKNNAGKTVALIDGMKWKVCP